MRALLGIAIAFATGACTPNLQDGVYACTDTAECPDGFYCRYDDLCYQNRPTDQPLYAPCENDSECASDDCYVGVDNNASAGFCSTPCTGMTCPSAGGANGVCAAGNHCMKGCMNTDECDGVGLCLAAPGANGKACMQVVDMAFLSRAGCTSTMTTCQPGLVCELDTNYGTTGICSWPCGNTADSCPGTGECLELPANLNIGLPTDWTCLAPCNAAPDCVGGLTCIAFPGTTKHCVPAGWAAAL